MNVNLPAPSISNIRENEDVDKIEDTIRWINTGTQLQSGDFITDFSQTITKDEDLNTLTGITKFELLNMIIEVAQLAYPQHNSEKTNIRRQIIMTVMKLKHNSSYTVFKVLFKRRSISHCREIILETVDILYNCLKEAINFLTTEEISRNIPIYFNSFKDGRVVMDCTEIFILQPNSLYYQIITYSQYSINAHTQLSLWQV